jgi:hypothetical protein
MTNETLNYIIALKEASREKGDELLIPKVVEASSNDNFGEFIRQEEEGKIEQTLKDLDHLFPNLYDLIWLCFFLLLFDENESNMYYARYTVQCVSVSLAP